MGIMVTGKMFTIKKEDTSYFLPRSRVPYFKDAVGRLLFEEFAVMFPKIEPELEDCFKQGGGIPYSSYADFHQVFYLITLPCYFLCFLCPPLGHLQHVCRQYQCYMLRRMCRHTLRVNYLVS